MKSLIRVLIGLELALIVDPRLWPQQIAGFDAQAGCL
jgi:hypothetical protein